MCKNWIEASGTSLNVQSQPVMNYWECYLWGAEDAFSSRLLIKMPDDNDWHNTEFKLTLMAIGKFYR